jgi:hypothetical protein
MPMKFIKLNNGALIRTGDDVDDEIRGVNPGSVVAVEEEMHDMMVHRGLGESHPGPAWEAPAPDEPAGPPAIERADLAEKIGRAEQGVAPRQQPKK